MSRSTGIEWCDATFNPWWGCERVSPACAHCYADTFARRVGKKELWPSGSSSEHEFRFFGDKHWEEPYRWVRLAEEGRLPDGSENLDGHRPRVFCASMADVFEDRPELEEHRLRLFDLIVATPELDWLILTKRPEFARDWLAKLYAMQALVADHLAGAETIRQSPLLNVWMGVSIENSRYTWRGDVLREIPAAVRFISAEPLLGSLAGGVREPCRIKNTDTGEVVPLGPMYGSLPYAQAKLASEKLSYPYEVVPGRAPLDLTEIDWVIIGGESGAKSRPFRLEHARELIDEIYAHRAHQHRGYGPPAIFVKQLGAKPVGKAFDLDGSPDYKLPLRDRKGGDLSEWPDDLRVREFPPSST